MARTKVTAVSDALDDNNTLFTKESEGNENDDKGEDEEDGEEEEEEDKTPFRPADDSVAGMYKIDETEFQG